VLLEPELPDWPIDPPELPDCANDMPAVNTSANARVKSLFMNRILFYFL
jgi:hypothetical protein